MLNIEDDFTIFDGAERVQLIQPGASGKRQIIGDALRFPVTTRDAIKADGTYRLGDVKFNIPKKQASVFRPAPGDFIQTADDPAELWVIGNVEQATLKTRFVCWGKRADFDSRRAVTIRVFKSIPKRDSSGGAYTEGKLVAECEGVINEVASRFEITEGRRRVEVTHQIYTTEQIDDVTAGGFIEDESGTRYNIRRITAKGTLGEAMLFECELQRTPVRDD